MAEEPHPVTPQLKFELAWGDLILQHEYIATNFGCCFYRCPCGWHSPHFFFPHGSSFIPDTVYQTIFQHVLTKEGGQLADPSNALPASEELCYPIYYDYSYGLGVQIPQKLLVFRRFTAPVYKLPFLDMSQPPDFTYTGPTQIQHAYFYKCMICEWQSKAFDINSHVPNLIHQQLNQHAKQHKQKLEEEAVVSNQMN